MVLFCDIVPTEYPYTSLSLGNFKFIVWQKQNYELPIY